MRILIGFLFVSCMSQNPVFINKIISDFETNSCFIVFRVQTSEYIGEVFVPNEGLYYYYQKTKGFSKEEYKSFVKKQIFRSGPLIVSDTLNLNNWDFKKILNIESVLVNAKKGEAYFINKYFDNKKVLKDGITDDEKAAIIQKLFEWGIPSKIDDETGYLILSR
jgi:hypothetical protein